MAININIQHQFPLIAQFLTTVSEVAIKKATVQAVNRTARTIRSKGASIIAKRLNLPINGRKQAKSGEDRTPPGIKQMIEISKAKYQRSAPISSIMAMVHGSGKSVSLYHFLIGRKTPQSQKGIPVKGRPYLSVQVLKGKKTVLGGGGRKGAFIAKARTSGSLQVFRRRGASSLPLSKLSVPSIAHFMGKPEIKNKLKEIARKRIAEEMPRQLKFYANQIPRPRRLKAR